MRTRLHDLILTTHRMDKPVNIPWEIKKTNINGIMQPEVNALQIWHEFLRVLQGAPLSYT